MAIDKLINHTQGEEIKTALNSIATNIATVGAVSLESLGMGYTTCSTAASTTAKTATLTGYTLNNGGTVSVKFTYAVPASATLNINSAGAKPIYFKGAAITAGIIKAGDIATFLYTNNQYQLINIDNTSGSAVNLAGYTAETTPTTWATPAATDTLNDAVKKLDNNTRLNQSNILSIYNTGYAQKNLLNSQAVTTVKNGITFTVNTDKSITISGTNSVNDTTNLPITTGYVSNIWIGKKLSGCTGGSDTTYAIACMYSHDGVSFVKSGYQTNADYIIEDYEYIYIIATIYNNYAITGTETLYPMIRDIGDTTYQPYTMSNADITAWILAHS